MKHYIEFCWGALLAVLAITAVVVALSSCATRYERTGECSVNEFYSGQCPGKKDPFQL